ncbi:MAG: osmotically inducible protein OsmC [Anaerolineae bacterium]|nr:MAG: osmotically inducible protein OsmC [Anaerolineae bacterium]WKZ45023.1 MAG: OsmC family protein [Anaerolineales bacterium]
MELLIDFPGGARVDAHFDGHTVKTDQPAMGGGEDSAPTPFEVFLASIGACAGIYILGFCRQRNLPTEGIRILQRTRTNPNSGKLEKVEMEIQIPPSFPQQYHSALIRSAELCKVKKTLENPPLFEITTRETETA